MSIILLAVMALSWSWLYRSQVELSGTAVWPGLDGLLLLLSALARQPLHCAWAHVLPVVCGAQAAFVACPTTHTADTLVMMLIAQLMPDTTAPAKPGPAAGQDGKQQQDQAATATATDANGAAEQQQEQQEQYEAQQQQQQQMRCVVQLAVRASSHEVLLAVKQQPETWVNDISQVRGAGGCCCYCCCSCC